MTYIKTPIACSLCSTLFIRKNGGREKQCSTHCRFWAKVDKSEGCWEWTASLFSATGYGQFALTSTKPETAHRMAWVLTNGDITDGLFVLHKCDNRKCCNPDHLFLGTHQDNITDMCQKGRYVGPLGYRATLEQKKDRKVRMVKVWAVAKMEGYSRPLLQHFRSIAR